MNTVFVDTSFYIAFSSSKDAWHKAAKYFALNFTGTMLTTEFVLIEFANYLSAPKDRNLFLRFYEMLQKDVSTSIIPASSEHIQSGLSIYAKRPDKGWSLTDCISMSIMQKRGLTEALTADHHFAQAGFNTLLKR